MKPLLTGIVVCCVMMVWPEGAAVLIASLGLATNLECMFDELEGRNCGD